MNSRDSIPYIELSFERGDYISLEMELLLQSNRFSMATLEGQEDQLRLQTSLQLVDPGVVFRHNQVTDISTIEIHHSEGVLAISSDDYKSGGEVANFKFDKDQVTIEWIDESNCPLEVIIKLEKPAVSF